MKSTLEVTCQTTNMTIALGLSLLAYGGLRYCQRVEQNLRKYEECMKKILATTQAKLKSQIEFGTFFGPFNPPEPKYLRIRQLYSYTYSALVIFWMFWFIYLIIPLYIDLMRIIFKFTF